jgi:hypothetical protein
LMRCSAVFAMRRVNGRPMRPAAVYPMRKPTFHAAR